MNKDRKYNWVALLFFLAGLYMFIFFEDFVFDENYIDSAITTKDRGVRSIIYVITQNKYGFWIMRCIPLIVGFAFGKEFLDGVKREAK
ncbi:hypothetical protein ACE939_11095 [Aquimarina sp. W85]|uniref:hypothetical protein n=1 Tax=Aquimarina rhodophyticola TaxID=3342246 RepID=UPI003670DB09